MRPHSSADRHAVPRANRGECSDLLVCVVAGGFVLAIGLLLMAVSCAV